MERGSDTDVHRPVVGHPLLDVQRVAGNQAAARIVGRLQRDDEAAEDGASSRPSSGAMASAYAPVDYGTSARDFLENTDRKIRKTFEKNGWENTCAARLSVALIDAGHGIPSGGYLDSQGRRWMASARATRRALNGMWGAPDRTLTTSEEVDEAVRGLASGQVAVFAGQGHVGILKPGYRDPYVHAYVPVDIWVLAP
jgi:hypothetical protein